MPIDVGLNLSRSNSGYRWAGPDRIELLRIELLRTRLLPTRLLPTRLAVGDKPGKEVWFYKVHFTAIYGGALSVSGMTPRGEVIVLMTGKTFLPQPRKR